MKLANASLFRFTLPLTQPFRAGTINISERNGLLLRVENEQGIYGFGEIMPLPGWQNETLTECEEQIRKLLWTLKGFVIPEHLEELSGGFNQWLSQFNQNDLFSSVRYGFEAAMLHVLANTQKRSIATLIADTLPLTVAVNALVTGSTDDITKKIDTSLAEGFRTFKLKVGKRSIEEDIKLVQQTHKQIGDCALRLDANQSWQLQEAIQFLQAVEQYDIEYIEEPLQNSSELSALCREVPSARIALDESLLHTIPEQLESRPGITTIILKPPMFGVEQTMRFARRAQSLGMSAVISSPFESGVGLAMSATLAAAIGQKAAGLESYTWLAQDILEPRISIRNGSIALADCHITSERINWSRLEQIV